MRLDDIKKLHQKRYRQAFGHFLVEGEHPVLELQKAASRNPLLQSCKLYVTSAHENWESPFETVVISDLQMAQIADTRTPQGIIALVPMVPASAPRDDEHAVYLHEIQDPGNLGTILRTLAWFGHCRCLLSPGSVDPYNSKVVRASMGAIFHVPIELEAELRALRERFKRIACLDVRGETLRSADFKTFDCYLFGNEARGLPREELAALNARPFTIAGCGAIESLNLASAVNMCVYELNR
ncbi:MAG: TrmH family RNA methyltransferase [Steroidobacteraceae bacterium]